MEKKYTKEEIKNLIYEFRENELEGWDEPYHYNAEAWEGFKDFIKYLEN